MSAARLREAAKWIRLYVDKLTTDTDRWDEAFPSGMGLYADTSSYERLIVHPGVGLALADWLDDTAERWPWGVRITPERGHALAVADLILGGKP
jgi:hypothetical protein